MPDKKVERLQGGVTYASEPVTEAHGARVNLSRKGRRNTPRSPLGSEKPTAKELAEMKDFITWVLLNQARNAVFKARDRELRQYGVSAGQACVLCAVEVIGNHATPSEISRYTIREPHTTSQVLSRMEKKGLVRRTNDLERKNMVRVALTKKGKQAYYQSTKLESVSKVLSCLSEEERHQLNAYLQRLRAAQLKELGMEVELPFLRSI